MKLRSYFFAGAIVATAFVSCNRDELKDTVLDAPVLEVSETSPTSFTVAWKEVSGADMYAYEFKEEQASTESLSVTFNGLETDTTYTLRVRAVSTVASVVSDWSEISVDLVSGGGSEDPVFSVNLSTQMKPGYILNVKTSPADKEYPYYFEPVPGSVYETFGNDPEAMFADIISTYLLYYQGDKANAFENLHMTGDKDVDYNISGYAEPEFHVFAAGIDDEMNITTEVEHVQVAVDLPVSENTFLITVDICTQSFIQVTVAPSNGDQYALILQDKETVDAMSEAQLRNFLLSLVNDNSLCTNEVTMKYENGIVPSHDYSVLVFGCEDGVMTTEISRKDLRTPDPEVVEDLTFEFSVEVLGPQEAEVEVVPSDQQASYFYDVVSLSDWDAHYRNEPSLYVEEMASSQGRSIAEYLDNFGSIGTETASYDSFYLSSGTDYILFAMGYYFEGDEVVWLDAQSTGFSTPAYGGGAGGNLTFQLQIMAVEIGRFYVDVIPSDDTFPYVYAVLTDAEYDEYYPDDVYGYFYGQYESSGFEGTFADYVGSISRTGETYELSDYHASDSCRYYKLIAAEVSMEGGNVVFYEPAETDEFFEY